MEIPVKKSNTWKYIGLGGCGCVVLVFVGLGILGAVIEQMEKKPATHQVTAKAPVDGTDKTDATDTTVDKPATWHKVDAFQGSSMKKTHRFTVGSEWKVIWQTKPGSMGQSNFIVSAVGEDGNEIAIANEIGKAGEESCQYDAGTYYLDINTGQPYVIEIWDKR